MSDQPTHPHHHVHETPPMHDSPDQWHDHSADEQPQHAHAEVGNAKMIIGVGIALFAVIHITILIVYAYYTLYTTRRLAEQERIRLGDMTSPSMQARAYQDSSLIKLNQHDWLVIPSVEKDKPATVLIQRPVEAAAADVISHYSTRKD